MGLITGILSLPIAPMRGMVWVADQVLRQAEREYYDPMSIRRQLEDIDELRADGRITSEDASEWEEQLIRRLMEAPARRADPKG